MIMVDFKHTLAEARREKIRSRIHFCIILAVLVVVGSADSIVEYLI